MAFHPDLRLLAASRDRDLTPEARGAVSQLSASCDVDLTVAHVTTDGDVPAPPVPFDFELHAAPRRLQRRELAGPDAARTLARLCADEPFDLVLAPTRRQGVAWPRLRGSFRERLLRLSATPLWTAGPGVPGRHFHRPIRSVACLLDFDANPERLLQRAAAFARRMDARLHVLAVLPPVDESTLALVLTSDTPLLPSAAVARIEQLCAGRPSPMVDVVVGGEFWTLGGTGGDGGLKIAIVDAGGESAHEFGQIRRRAQDAPRVVGACKRCDECARASSLGELLQILPAAGTDVEGVRFFADDGEESKLGAEPHGKISEVRA